MKAWRITAKFWLLNAAPFLLLLFCSVSSVTAADWPTFGNDPQRSGSVQDAAFSAANAGDLELKWSTQVDNVPLALNSLTAPIVATNVVTEHGTKMWCTLPALRILSLLSIRRTAKYSGAAPLTRRCYRKTKASFFAQTPVTPRR